MGWGYDDWLLNRESRKDWMRTVALSALAEQILRTPATAAEGLACVLDELVTDRPLSPRRALDELVEEDIATAAAALVLELAVGRGEGAAFQSLAFVLSDGAPYVLTLALVDGPVSVDGDWEDAITWRSSSPVDSAVLDAVIPLLDALPAHARREADYIVPLAYCAFLMRDVFRAVAATETEPASAAIVIYKGGDALEVPIGR